ncbi:hypothetical protein BJ546DRAFT_858253 [Cryomyces antarcticus]
MSTKSSQRAPSQSLKSPSKSSLRREALRERSNNSQSTSTIRAVEYLEAPPVHLKSPFPSLPSQRFSPRKQKRSVETFVYEDEGSPTDSASRSKNRITYPSRPLLARDSYEVLQPRPLLLKKGDRASTPTTKSNTYNPTNESPIIPASSRFSQGTLLPTFLQYGPGSPTGGLGIQQPNKYPEATSTIRPVIPSFVSKTGQELVSKASESSLASSASSETLPASRQGGSVLLSSTSVNLAPPRQSNRYSGESSNWQRAGPTVDYLSAASPVYGNSAESIPRSDQSYRSSERPLSIPSPTHASLYLSTSRESIRFLQYPIVRPSSSNSFASSSKELPVPIVVPRIRPREPRNSGSYQRQWNSHLSTIPSESDRLTQLWTDGSPHWSGASASERSPPKDQRRRTIESFTSLTSSAPRPSSSILRPSSDRPEEMRAESAIPEPLFATSKVQVKRISDETADTVSELHPPPLRLQRSGRLRGHSDSRPSSIVISESDRGSQGSTIFPQWVHSYYDHSEQTSLAATSDPNASLPRSFNQLRTMRSASTVRTARSNPTPPASLRSANFATNLWKPRSRPRWPLQHQTSNDSLAIETAPPLSRQGRVSVLLGEAGPPTEPHSYVPIFKAASSWTIPSLDESFASARLFGPVNRQILLFCVGFLLPLAWFLAAVLPLPYRRRGPQMRESRLSPDLADEAQVVESGRWMEERRWQKARWWRRLNRGMCVLGVAVLGTVVSFFSRSSRDVGGVVGFADAGDDGRSRWPLSRPGDTRFRPKRIPRFRVSLPLVQTSRPILLLYPFIVLPCPRHCTYLTSPFLISCQVHAFSLPLPVSYARLPHT